MVVDSCSPVACWGILRVPDIRDGRGERGQPKHTFIKVRYSLYAPILVCMYICTYSWIGRPVQTQKKTICRETERATTDLNIRMKSSPEGASNGAG